MRLADRRASRPLSPHQAALRVDWRVYFRAYPSFAKAIAIHLAFFVLSLAVGAWALSGLFLVLALPLVRRMAAVGRHFRLGTVGAAKVVSVDPPLVACLADLSMAKGHAYPTIRVVRPPLERLKIALQTGMNLPAISLFSGTPGGYKWDGFQPIPAQCASSDSAEVERLLDGIPEWQWVLLNEGLFEIPRPYKPGLYPIPLPKA